MMVFPRVAYFTMEIALESALPTYAGGLGVLAGDTVRSFADMDLPIVAVSLVHRRGYFRQRLSGRGRQTEKPDLWDPAGRLEPLDPRVSVEIEDRSVAIRAWRYRVRGETGAELPVILLDADLPENARRDRKLTDSLYGGDERYRLCQEVILGMAGILMLRALGYDQLEKFHLNEGHAALVAVALLEEQQPEPPHDREDLDRLVERVRAQCVFTTHTPVPAGHDRFPSKLARRVVGRRCWSWLRAIGTDAELNMSELALRASHFVNSVAMRHGEVSRSLFPDHPIRSITNGIHAPTWAAPSFRELYDHRLPGWRSDPLSLRAAVGIPVAEVESAHRRSKEALIRYVRDVSSLTLDPQALTIGFARRATAYKRANLLFRDIDRLALIAEKVGPIQIVLAGRAHPKDHSGKAMIREIFRARRRLRGRVGIVYLANYDMNLGRLLCAGSDLWLNTPVPPLEASGTSGMKAALNGVPSLSILDGWWVEGYLPGVTGWPIGPDRGLEPNPEDGDERDADALYRTLESDVMPCFYGDHARYVRMMRSTIAVNASYFNTQRMVVEYLYAAYRGSEATERMEASRALGREDGGTHE